MSQPKIKVGKGTKLKAQINQEAKKKPQKQNWLIKWRAGSN